MGVLVCVCVNLHMKITVDIERLSPSLSTVDRILELIDSATLPSHQSPVIPHLHLSSTGTGEDHLWSISPDILSLRLAASLLCLA